MKFKTMKVLIDIETESDAFQDGNRGHEIARILNKLAGNFMKRYEPTSLYDEKGNKVGSVNYMRFPDKGDLDTAEGD